MCYHTVYSISNIEIMKRRNKPSSPCIEGAYDETIIQNAIKSVGCKFSFHKLMNGSQLCKSKEEYKLFEKELYVNDHPPPCQSIKSVYQSQTTTQTPHKKKMTDKPNKPYCTVKNAGTHKFSVTVRLLDGIYKETIYSKEYTIETLVGNTGGYIGKLAAGKKVA